MRRNKSFFIISSLLAATVAAAAHMMLIKTPESFGEIVLKTINVFMGGYLGLIWVFSVSRLLFYQKAEKMAKGESALFLGQKGGKATIIVILVVSLLFDLMTILIQGSSAALCSVIIFFMIEPCRFLYYDEGILHYIDDWRTEPLDVIDASLLETEQAERIRVLLLTKEPKPLHFDVQEEQAVFFDRMGQVRNSGF